MQEIRHKDTKKRKKGYPQMTQIDADRDKD
jgi:hypothetical protein